MKKELLPIIFLVGILAIGCKNDHDSPELSPIDTSKVKIISDVTSNPAAGVDDYYRRSDNPPVGCQNDSAEGSCAEVCRSYCQWSRNHAETLLRGDA